MNGQNRLKGVFVVAMVVALIGAGMMSFNRGAQAQDTAPVTGTLTVNGQGLVTVVPDAASVSVGVNVINVSLSEAQAAATALMNDVIETLKAAGIDEKDIQTSNYSVNIMQNYDNQGYPAEITGYQVNNQVNVTVRDLDKLGAILEEAVDKGANSIYGIYFIVTDSSEAASQARAAAIADAMKRAEEIAAATGTKLGKIISVTETYAPSTLPTEFYGGMGGGMDMAKAAVPVQAGGSVVEVDVQMTFELIQ